MNYNNLTMLQSNKDIIFIVPSFKPQLNEESVGTLILAKKLQLAGFSPYIYRYWESPSFDYHDYTHFIEDSVGKILNFESKIVSFYCRCTDYHVSLDIARRIKSQSPQTTIIFGGPQAELVSLETLKRFAFVDYVACSEGENTIVPFVEMILNQEGSARDIPGLCYRTNKGHVIQNPLPAFLHDNYIREYYYYDLIPNRIIENSRCLTIDVGRGCPFSCTFCSTKSFWKQRFRLRNIEDIVKEMKWIVHNLGIDKFDFDHDLFTVNHARLREFCELLHKENLKVKWYCSSRLDTITPALIDMMANAGMTNILFGVESGSPRMQKLINKNLDFSKSREIILHAVSKNIKVKTSFIYGFPQEDENDFESTLRLIYDFQKSGAHVVVWRCGILNGTAMYEEFKDELYLTRENWKNQSFYGFTENYDLISRNPSVFPQFYDHPNPLRQELIYFDLFFSLWRDFDRDSFDVLANDFICNSLTLLKLYRVFVEANQEKLSKCHPVSLDKYWDLSPEQCASLISRFKNKANLILQKN